MSTGSSYDESTKGMVAFGAAAFGGIMLVTVGIFQILEGLAAIADDKVYVTGIDYIYEFDVTTWGWIHLTVGIIALITGIGIVAAQTWAMFVGIILAVFSAALNFAFLPYYPFWSIAIVALNVFVIWALCTQLANRPSY